MAKSPTAPPGKRVLSIDAVADLAYGVGFRGEGLVTALAVAKAESGFDAHNSLVNTYALGARGPSVGSVDRGLWQINDYWHKNVSDAQAYDPAGNARAAYSISKGGTSWRPWVTFTGGHYRKHLTEARAAADARTATGGTGSVGGGEPPAAPAGISPDLVTAPPSLPTAYVAPRSTSTIQIGGTGGSTFSPDLVIGGTVDLSVDEVSQVTLEVLNIDSRFVGNVHATPLKGARFDWGAGLALRVAAVETRPGPEGGQITITARSAGVQELRRDRGAATQGAAVKDQSPTEYAASAAAVVGLRFQGQGSPRRSDIAPADVDGRLETRWEVLSRLAQEADWLLFEAAGVLYFGSALWLTERNTEVFVGWPSYGDMSALDVPVIRGSEDDPRGVTVQVLLPRWRGELVRPGMRLKLQWGDTAPYLVSRVSWPVDGGLAPVVVEAFSPQPAEPAKPPDGAQGPPPAPAPVQTDTSGGFRWPTLGRVSSEFGPRGGRIHRGIDIAVPTGTPIVASQAGKVGVASFVRGYGEVVYVDHGTIETRYAHNSRLLVRVGEQVTKGQKIAEAGSTGNSSGPHCHFEVRVNGTAENPRRHVPGQPVL